MYSLPVADDAPLPAAAESPLERELKEIEALMERALASRDILYCAPIARHLVEREIPRLLEIIRELQASGREDVDVRMLEALGDIRHGLDILRDLIDRR